MNLLPKHWEQQFSPLCFLVRGEGNWKATLMVENFGEQMRLLNQERIFYNRT